MPTNLKKIPDYVTDKLTQLVEYAVGTINNNYSPQFQHQDWIDNVDLVSAEDPIKGFNKRFKDLQIEFDAISKAIGNINLTLEVLSNVPKAYAVIINGSKKRDYGVISAEKKGGNTDFYWEIVFNTETWDEETKKFPVIQISIQNTGEPLFSQVRDYTPSTGKLGINVKNKDGICIEPQRIFVTVF